MIRIYCYAAVLLSLLGSGKALSCMDTDDLLGLGSKKCSRFETDCYFHYLAVNMSGRISEGIQRSCSLRSACAVYSLDNSCKDFTQLSEVGKLDVIASIQYGYPGAKLEHLSRAEFCCCNTTNCNTQSQGLLNRNLMGLQESLSNPIDCKLCYVYILIIIILIRG